MNIINRLTLQTMKKNRTRTIVTIIGVILSATMFTAVTTFCSSMYAYLREAAEYVAGNYHVYVEDLPGSKLNEVLDDERLKSSCAAEYIGYAEMSTVNEYKPYLYVAGATDDFFDLMPVHLTEGRMPENGDEIILPNHLYVNGGVMHAMGDVIELELGDRMSDGVKLMQSTPMNPEVEEQFSAKLKKSYTVVGFYERPRFENYTAPGYTALTVSDGTIKPDVMYDGFLAVNNPRANFEPFLEENGLVDYVLSLNTNILMFDGYTIYANWTSILYNTAIIFGLLIFIGSVSLIYNAFSISVSERTKQFGLISSIGATKKQIRRSILFEATSISAVGIPIGLGVGMLGMGITLYLCKDLFRSLADSPVDITFRVSVAAIVIAIIVALITVLISAWIPSRRAMRITPIEAIRQVKDVKVSAKQVRYSKLFVKLFGAEGVLAKKYYGRSRKKYRATITSLAMSVILFICTSSFCMYLIQLGGIGAGNSNYDLICYLKNDKNVELMGVLNEIEGLDSVDEVAASFFELEEFAAYIPDGDATNSYIDYMHMSRSGMLNLKDDSFIGYLDDASFREMLINNGLSPEEYFAGGELYPVVINRGSGTIYNRDEDGATRKTYEFQFLKNGTDSIMTVKPVTAPEGYEVQGIHWSGSAWGEGELKYYFTPVDDGSGIECEYDEMSKPIGMPTANVEFVQTHVYALIDEVPLGVETAEPNLKLIYPMSAYDEQIDAGIRINIYFRTETTTTAIQEAKTIMNDAGLSVTDDDFYDIAEAERTMRNLVTLIEVFSYGFIALISLISVANVFNTISTNVALRKRDYAMLRSIGMNEKGMRRMTCYECILYGSRSLFIGLPVSILLSFLIYLFGNGVRSSGFTLPWGSVIAAVLCVFAVVFASMLYSTSKLRKENTIDTLKNENI